MLSSWKQGHNVNKSQTYTKRERSARETKKKHTTIDKQQNRCTSLAKHGKLYKIETPNIQHKAIVHASFF